MTKIPASLRLLVRQRAGDRCEYCGLSQLGQEATFHIDHVTPVAAQSETSADNLALACVSCSQNPQYHLYGSKENSPNWWGIHHLGLTYKAIYNGFKG